ncbi:MAG: motif family protein [Rhizobium sp.]|nr:motif family protein [Rhizobium sp.]
MRMLKRLTLSLTAAALPAMAVAQDIPPCALTGSMTMTIGGKPALRLSDVASCPPKLYEIITSISIDGQPMVHFKPGVSAKTRCTAQGNPTVQAEGKQANTVGDVACTAEK